ncbi:MAG: TSUP family transporter [Alphaproteobacteria bacterium]
MMDYLADFTNLSQTELLICFGVVFLAGLVRGFAGFALSAIVMAGAVLILPPIELIPVTYMLEGAASILMFRGGLKSANMRVVKGLVIGSFIGVPIGLLATTTFPIEVSKLVALCVIMALAIAQLFRFAPKFLDTQPGLYGSGLVAGIATGLASVGGMVVALYVLASKSDPKTMRASLVVFLFVGMFTSLIYLVLYDVLTLISLKRGLVFTPPVLIGVVLGSALFRPSLIVFYRRFCLTLLLVLAAVGLINLL